MAVIPLTWIRILMGWISLNVYIMWEIEREKRKVDTDDNGRVAVWSKQQPTLFHDLLARMVQAELNLVRKG
ncbi:transmembrane protein, putative [Medicago truncatula]|uniref:Transmembrane protein, putative n=1 Tax=Medicago truncatula TaxID=3880 RepID=G7LD47_MEDTR|nr:transmembrane protein, putative [Medicago truncatula]